MNWRTTKGYRIWRVSVIRRDKVCQVCGSNQKREAHHINNGEHHPKGRFDVENGVCLCDGCHSQYHNNFNTSYKVKTTKENWENFLVLVGYLKETICSKQTL